MFSYIKGTLEYKGEDYIVIENGNIGYEIKTSGSVINRLSQMHERVTVYTYLYVREDEMTLYGFLKKDELSIFKLLISISGVGPKAALSVLTALNVEELHMAVLSEDSKAISKANGIGSKTAQRIIIELKDKLKLEDIYGELPFESPDVNVTDSDMDAVKEAAMALTSLGYSNAEALRAIKKVENYKVMNVEELLKAALKRI